MKVFFVIQQNFLTMNHICKNENVGAKHAGHSLVPFPSMFGAHVLKIRLIVKNSGMFQKNVLFSSF